MTPEQTGYLLGPVLVAVLALLGIQYARRLKIVWRRRVSIGTLSFIIAVSLLTFLGIDVVWGIPFAAIIYVFAARVKNAEPKA